MGILQGQDRRGPAALIDGTHGARGNPRASFLPEMKKYDLIIVGGGAAGLVAASARPGKGVLVCEALQRAGKKLLASGNGKCNLLNRDLSPAYYNAPGFAGVVFKRYPEAALEDFYRSLGLKLRFLDGRGYPLSETSGSVLDVLRRAVSDGGAEIRTGCRVDGIEKKDGVFAVSTVQGVFYADKVLFATGSDASFGSDSLSLAEGFQRTVPFRPGLAPLITDPAPIAGLNGVRVKSDVSLFSGGRLLKTERGEVQFKTFGLSGIAVFNLASVYSHAGCPADAFVSVNLPQAPVREVRADFAERAERYGTCGRVLSGVFHRMVSAAVLRAAGLGEDSPCGKNEAERLADAAADFRLPVKRVADRSLAQVMCGGVATDGIDPETMESRVVKGLFFAGEAVDVDGLSGGYNLMWAAASALTAAESSR